MDKEEIRKNRERIRKNMQGCFVIVNSNSDPTKTILDVKKIEE